MVEERASHELTVALTWVNRLKHLVERSDGLLLGRGEVQHLLDNLRPERRVLIADSQGGVTFYSDGHQTVFDISDREYFQQHAKGVENYIGPILLTRLVNVPIVTVSVRLDAPDGSFRGVIAMSIDPMDLVRYWRSLDMGPGGMVKITRLDGSYVANDQLVVANDVAVDVLLADHLKKTPNGTWEAFGPMAEAHRIVAHQKFRSLPLVAVVGIPVDTVVHEWMWRQIRVLGAASPLMVLVIGMALWARVAFRREGEASAALIATLSERELLLAEVHHRVKNNLQIVQSLLMMEFLTAPPELRAGYDKSLQRIQAMGMVHELLYKSGDFGRIRCKDYVERLGALLLGEVDGISLTVDGDEADLDLDRAVPFAMAVNEILSNTLKHAFPDGRTGFVAVHLSHRDGKMVLSVIDNGIGMPAGFEPAQSASMGARLLIGLSKQLNGTVTFQSIAGTVVRLEFPL